MAWAGSAPPVQIAVLIFDGFNGLNSFTAASILNRGRSKGWKAQITSPTDRVASMNGVTIQRQKPLAFAAEADAVPIGSGVKTGEIAADAELLAQIRLDPSGQLTARSVRHAVACEAWAVGRPART